MLPMRNRTMSNPDFAPEADAAVRLLEDDELDAATGGLVVIAIIAVLIPMLIPDMPQRHY